MRAPLVTVLIDTYNYGRFIEQAIESVLIQDLPMEHIEVVVVDDGSTDDTAERVKKYGSRIQYFYKPNGGQASAFNFGFRHAQGDIVVLLDADDYFLAGKLKRLVEEFRRYPDAGMVYHQLLELRVASGELTEPEMTFVSGFLPDDRERLLKFVPYSTSCLAFRRSVVERLLPVPEGLRLQADGYITLLAVLLAPVRSVKEPLAVYRLHGGNLYYADDATATRETKRRQIESYMNMMREVYGWARRHRLDLPAGATRLFLGHHLLPWEERGFLVDPPSRGRFFWFLVRQNYLYSPLQTWKFTLLNYLLAVRALATGYHGAASIYGQRSKAVERLQTLFKRSRPGV